MDTAVAVPPFVITSEISNSYTSPTSGVGHTILVLHLAAYGQFLAARLTIPNSTTVRTILEALKDNQVLTVFPILLPDNEGVLSAHYGIDIYF